MENLPPVLYSFTITLKPRMYDLSPLNQLRQTAPIGHTLRHLGEKVTLVYEITPDGCNVHYHGIIEFKQKYGNDDWKIRQVFSNMFRGHKMFGFWSLKVIDNLDSWKEYLRKDLRSYDFGYYPHFLLDEHNVCPPEEDANGIYDLYYGDDGMPFIETFAHSRERKAMEAEARRRRKKQVLKDRRIEMVLNRPVLKPPGV